jgi:hypothetical protein
MFLAADEAIVLQRACLLTQQEAMLLNFVQSSFHSTSLDIDVLFSSLHACFYLQKHFLMT